MRKRRLGQKWTRLYLVLPFIAFIDVVSRHRARGLDESTGTESGLLFCDSVLYRRIGVEKAGNVHVHKGIYLNVAVRPLASFKGILSYFTHDW